MTAARPLALPLALALLVLGVLGCTGRVLPQSAQAGSTVVIPLGAWSRVGPVGFGGSEVDDRQRGQLAYFLDAPAQLVRLETRGSALVTGHPASVVARGSPVSHQIVSLVDIPESAPRGTHPIDVFWIHTDPATGRIRVEEIAYEGELSVLPPEIPVSGPGGAETIVGRTTPFERWRCRKSGCSWSELGSASVGFAIPEPTLRIRLDDAVWAAELRVEYPEAAIDVVDAFETPLRSVSHRATTWHRKESAGVLRVGAAAERHGFDALSVAFALEDAGGARLDPASVSVEVERAWSRDGEEVPRSAAIEGVF